MRWILSGRLINEQLNRSIIAQGDGCDVFMNPIIIELTLHKRHDSDGKLMFPLFSRQHFDALDCSCEIL